MSTLAPAPTDAAVPEDRPGLLAPLAAGVPVGAALALIGSRPAVIVLHGLLGLVVTAAAVIDLRRRIIPNRLTGPAALGALAIGLALDPAGEPRRLLWAAMVAGFLLVFALISPSGLGMGDVKLVAVMGLALGPPVLGALIVALLANVAAAGILIARRGLRLARRTTLPFGPFLAVGAIAAAVLASGIIGG